MISPLLPGGRGHPPLSPPPPLPFEENRCVSSSIFFTPRSPPPPVFMLAAPYCRPDIAPPLSEETKLSMTIHWFRIFFLPSSPSFSVSSRCPAEDFRRDHLEQDDGGHPPCLPPDTHCPSGDSSFASLHFVPCPSFPIRLLKMEIQSLFPVFWSRLCRRSVCALNHTINYPCN